MTKTRPSKGRQAKAKQTALPPSLQAVAEFAEYFGLNDPEVNSEEFQKSIRESIAAARALNPRRPKGIRLFRDLYMRPMHDLTVVGTDKSWAHARRNADFSTLFDAAYLAVEALAKLSAGLEIANTDTLTGHRRAVFRDYVKTSKAVIRQLQSLSRSSPGKQTPRLWQWPSKVNASERIRDCVEAWRTVLQLILAAAERHPRTSTENLVRGVIEKDPSLGARLNLDDAINNASSHGIDIFDVIRSRWGRGSERIHKSPRDVAFELTRWACGVESTKAVQKRYELARAASHAHE